MYGMSTELGLAIFALEHVVRLESGENLGIAALRSFCSWTTATPNTIAPPHAVIFPPTDDTMADALKDVVFKTVQVDALVRAKPAIAPRPQPRHCARSTFTRQHGVGVGRG